MAKKKVAKPKFRVGQVIRIALDFYETPARKRERFQQIVSMSPWPTAKGFELVFENGDRTHEKWARCLTKKERGA